MSDTEKHSQNSYVAIMAGGVGSRFWPASRERTPKQFLDITGAGTSLLQQTVSRLSNLIPIENVLIISNLIYADQILEQLPLLQRKQLILEPSRNNTAPCIAYTALHLQAIDPDAVFAVLPADHIINKEEAFVEAMKIGLQKAHNEEVIVTLGIEPTRPDTGYGYINFDNSSEVGGVYKVISFKENPSKEVAEKYLAKGGYVWNAGIFIWSCKTILNNFKLSAPQIVNVLCTDVSKFGTDSEQEYINEVYPKTNSISVDYAILEHAHNVFTIPVDIGWSDLGTWGSLYSFLNKDDDGNVIPAAHSEIQESSGNLIRQSNKDKLIVVKGLKDYIVIDEGDVLLIYPREEEQEIKQLRSSLKENRFE